MALNKRYFVSAKLQAVSDFLDQRNFTKLESSIENLDEKIFIIIDTEDELFWVADATNLERAKELAAIDNEQILETDLNQITEWKIN